MSDNKINILEFTHQRGFGGTDKESQTLIQFYNRDKFNVFAASYTGGPRAQWLIDNQITHIIDQDNNNLVEWIKFHKIDVALVYRGGWTESRDLWILKKAGVPIIIERNCFAKFDASPDNDLIDKHIFCSNVSHEFYKNEASHFYDKDKCATIYVPIDNSFFNSSKIDYASLAFGRFSRNDPSKWDEINILALPIIRNELPEAKFHVIGLPDNYRDFSQQLYVNDMIIEYTPPPTADGLIDFMNNISVFAHSSKIGESFGNTIAEAMSAGLPIVTHSGGDSAQAELVTNEYNGYVVDTNDFQAYADKIIYLLKNPVQKEQMGKLGQKRAQDWFDAKKLTEQYENIYTEQYKLKFNK